MAAFTNAKQIVPELFKQIIRNDHERQQIKALPVIPFDRAGALIRERSAYRRAAELMLRWHTDKGKAQ